MLLALEPESTFLALAAHLDHLGLTLCGVRSCTFPSRPEPAEASWHGPEGLWLRYRLRPDADARLLWQARTPRDAGVDPSLSDALQAAPLFWRWDAVEAALEAGSAITRRAAAAALAARWTIAKSEAALATLTRALFSESVETRRAAAREFTRLEARSARPALQRAAEHDLDLEVRIEARRALDRWVV